MLFSTLVGLVGVGILGDVGFKVPCLDVRVVDQLGIEGVVIIQAVLAVGGIAVALL